MPHSLHTKSIFFICYPKKLVNDPNDPYGLDSFADVAIGSNGVNTRSNSQLARAAPGGYKSGLG